MKDPGSVRLGTEIQSCNILAVTSNPINIIALVVRLWSINPARPWLARSLLDPFIIRALTHGQPRTNTPWVRKGLDVRQVCDEITPSR